MKTQNTLTTRNCRMASLVLAVVSTMFLFAAVAQATTYVVTNKDDSGTGSLRKAITNANINPGTDLINFNIPLCGGVCTITLFSELPFISDTVVIDGYTQSGAHANTLAQGNDAVLLIEINAESIPGDGIGHDYILYIQAPFCTIRGLILNRSNGVGIHVGSNSNLIAGNFIGTDPSGLFARPNKVDGIRIQSSSSNVIGGTAPHSRNIISGNSHQGNNVAGIHIRGSSATSNKIQGNFIGTNKNGNIAISNQAGIVMDTGANDNIVGGTTAGARNIISGNATFGIFLYDSNFNLIEGNFIGTTPIGHASVANGHGISVDDNCSFNKIGDTVAGAGNVISGNTFYGLGFEGIGNGLNQVSGNFIGTRADGMTPLGNGTEGIVFSLGAANNSIGGQTAGSTNVIAFNGIHPSHRSSGVRLLSTAGTGNRILGNSIHSNEALGIDLQAPVDKSGTEATPNDANDTDMGGNRLQNFPVITSAVIGGGLVTNIHGTLNSEANKVYRIEFFANQQCSTSGHGEGKTYLGAKNVTTSGNGITFDMTFPGSHLGEFVTATAIDPNGNTSEFSQCKQVAEPAQPGSIAFAAAGYSLPESGDTATITVTRSGGTSGVVSVQYAISDGSAKIGSDYTATNGTLQFADGVTTQTFTIPINDDSIFEGSETINLTLSNPGGGATLGNQSSATLTISDNDQQPALSINDVSLGEGNSGATPAAFSVTLSNPSYQQVVVTYSTNGSGSAILGNDYQPIANTLFFAPGETSKPVTVMVNGDPLDEPNETFVVQLGPQTNATLAKALGTGTILNDDAAVLRFSAANYSVAEGAGFKTITVERTGDTSQALTVNYGSSDHSNPADFIPCTSPGAGFASSRCDFTTAVGTLRFAAGETSKSFSVLISQDNYVEGPETLELTLSNPTGGAVFGVPSTAILSITDDPVEPATNTTENAADFVRSQYHDFLNREPDAPGLVFWTDNIEKCQDPARRPAGQTLAQCTDKQRESTAIAFFSSPEFQMTGGFVYRLYKGSLTGFPNYDNGSPGRFPTFLEFMTDVSQVSEGIVVNNQISGAVVEANRNRLAAEFVQRPEFVAKYGGLNNTFYVDELFNNTGIVPTAGEKQALVNGLTNATETRAGVLRKVVDGTVVISEGNIQFTTTYGQAFYNQEYRRVFVYMEYVGYLRRNSDAAGFIFWLGKLNQFNGDPFQAEMVRSFILSPEYRSRFGQP